MLCTVSFIFYHLDYCLSQNAQYYYSYVHNANITVNILLFIIKQLTLCLVKVTRQEDQKHIFNLVWPNKGLSCCKIIFMCFKNKPFANRVNCIASYIYFLLVFTELYRLTSWLKILYQMTMFIMCIITLSPLSFEIWHNLRPKFQDDLCTCIPVYIMCMNESWQQTALGW